jgi:thioredoxin 1
MNKITRSIVACTLALSCFTACNQQSASHSGINTKSALDQEIATNENVLVDFFADWCGPCKQMEPSFEKLQQAYGNKLKVIRIDVDAARSLADEMQVSSIPHIFFYKNGELKSAVKGYQSTEELKSNIAKALQLP